MKRLVGFAALLLEGVFVVVLLVLAGLVLVVALVLGSFISAAVGLWDCTQAWRIRQRAAKSQEQILAELKEEVRATRAGERDTKILAHYSGKPYSRKSVN